MLCRDWDQLCSSEEKTRWFEEAVKLEGIEPHILSVWWVAAEPHILSVGWVAAETSIKFLQFPAAAFSRPPASPLHVQLTQPRSYVDLIHRFKVDPPPTPTPRPHPLLASSVSGLPF